MVICHHFPVLDVASDDQGALNNEKSEYSTHGTFKSVHNQCSVLRCWVV